MGPGVPLDSSSSSQPISCIRRSASVTSSTGRGGCDTCRATSTTGRSISALTAPAGRSRPSRRRGSRVPRL
ncbi:hypothetical protein NXF25_003987 [Crotalus adamanteus]|uniref:Uncharacterized protein n=1 Tax=Crotalus adamanteus TaxID=8729 RepID=A0AAW1BUP5_CROAD